MDTTTISFGYWLRRWRRARDLTQEALAQRVGCAVVTISKFERDELRPSRQVAERLAECLAIASEERAAFIKAARAELSVGRIPPTTQPVDDPDTVSPTPMSEMAGSHGQESVALPTGTVTFLFTDIADNGSLWQRYPSTMPQALTRYVTLVRNAIGTYGGTIFRAGGELICAAFTSALDALAAALAAQRALQAQAWAESGPLRVRVALHTGTITPHDGDYTGLPVNRLGCILEVGHGGQVLLSHVTQELLRDELPPGVHLLDLGEHRLKDLIRPEHIFQLAAADLPTTFPPLVTLDHVRTNLPTQPTPFTGREPAVAAVRSLLSRGDVRLVTLTGPGGTGKTRLAIQTAADLLDLFTDGVYLVSLAPISDPELVTLTIAQTLGVKEGNSQPLLTSLKTYLSDKHLLLLLDNFEQVVAAAPLVAELLAAAPGLKTLVTSRSPLHIYGEHEYQVPTLALPKLPPVPPLERLRQYEGVRLFIERAQAVKPDFVVTNENAPAVAEICYRLDGLPLAIELAAARVKLLPPQALLARLSNRLRLLTGGARDLPARQQTLRGAIAWSEDLLSSNERMLFARLAVFVSGCTLDAVETICHADGLLESGGLDEVHALLNNSLLRQEDQMGGESRFVMLETIREYALERLVAEGQVEQLRQRHAAYYLALAEAAEPKLRGLHQQSWLERLEAEHDNLRAAMTWALESGEGSFALRLSAILSPFWEVRGHFTEGRQWLTKALDQGQDGSAALRAAAFTGAGTMAFCQCDYAQAKQWHQQALDLYRSLGDERGMAFALNNLGAQNLRQGDLEAAKEYFAESLKLAQRLGDQWLSAIALHSLGVLLFQQCNFEAAMRHFTDSLAIAQQLEMERLSAMTLQVMGEIARHQRYNARAVDLYSQSLTLQRKLGDQYGACYSLVSLGNVAMAEDNHAQAMAFYGEALPLCQAYDNYEQAAECLEGMAHAAARCAQSQRAARLLGVAERLREVIGAPVEVVARQDYATMVAMVRSALDLTMFERTWLDGRAMPLDKAIAYALSNNKNDERLLNEEL
jgi:predicted ATPase/class 3 adenylate cyclase